jgi:outer membrane immunogenic protein
MNRLIVAVGALAGLATMTSARAADLPLKAPPPAPAPVMVWTGCYIAGGVGYGMWNQDHFGEGFPGPVQLTASNTSGGRGWLGRVGGGCDYQIAPSFVIGILGDYDFANIHGFADVSGIGGDEKESAAWAIGGRLGYLPYPNLMTFVSAGWTQARFDQSNQVLSIFPIVSAGVFLPEHTYSGWFIGTGFEYQVPWPILHGLFWRTEYRYSQYSADDIQFLVTGTNAPAGIGLHSEKFTQTVTTSLIWKFNWFGTHY